MFVRWKVRPLGQPAYRRDIACAHREKGREAWTPVVVSSERVGSPCPQQKTLWSPAGVIRSCCAADLLDPIARTQWWGRLRLRCAALREGSQSNPFRDELLAELSNILHDIAVRVPEPTDVDLRVTAAWEALCYDPYYRNDIYHAHKLRLLLSWYRNSRGSDRAQPSPPGQRGARQGAVFVVPEEFGVLGLRWPCTREDVKRAWRAGLHRHHPDKGGTQKGFERWMTAYEEATRFCNAHGPRD